MKIKEFVTENKTNIGMGILGIAAVGALAYWVVKKFRKQPQDKTPPHNSSSNALDKSTQADTKIGDQKDEENQVFHEKFTKIVNQIRGLLDSNENKINQQVIKAIICGQYQLFTPEIRDLLFKSRKERRKYLEDGLEYAKIITKYQYEAEQIQQKYLGTILARFNIDRATWKEATEEWQLENEDGFSDLIRDQEQKLLLSYKNQNSKPKEYKFIENIFQFRIKTLQVLNPSIIGADLAADDAGKYEMIQSYVNDLVYQKFLIEQEDIQYSINLFTKTQKQNIAEFEDRIVQLMEAFIEAKQGEKESDFY